MKKKIIALSILLTLIISSLSLAKEAEQPEAAINAEDIGIETIDTEEVEIEVDIKEETEEVSDQGEAPVESPAAPDGYVEGYVDGTYFEPNTYDEETEEYNYICDQCEYVHCVSMDGNSYIYEEWCTVCGNGTSERITEVEFEALGVETDVEF